jgi:hypothetical protein
LNCAAAYAPWRADVLATRGLARLSLAGDGVDALSRSLRQQGVADLRLAVALDSTDRTVQWAMKNRP